MSSRSWFHTYRHEVDGRDMICVTLGVPNVSKLDNAIDAIIKWAREDQRELYRRLVEHCLYLVHLPSWQPAARYQSRGTLKELLQSFPAFATSHNYALCTVADPHEWTDDIMENPSIDRLGWRCDWYIETAWFQGQRPRTEDDGEKEYDDDPTL